MYYPYFRGKQFDLIALRTLLEENCLSKRIQPIIEPVKKNGCFYKINRHKSTNGAPFLYYSKSTSGGFCY
jgi:hypothetical protein